MYSIPQNQETRRKWMQQIQRHQTIVDEGKTYRVCMVHFAPKEITTSGCRTTLKKGALPTIFPK